MFNKLAFLLSLLLVSWFSHAQEITGDWYGRLDLPQIKLRINLHITSQGSTLAGALDSPDQDAFGISLDTVFLVDNTLTFTLNSAGITYSGVWNGPEQTIAGTFKQGGQNTPLHFTRTEMEPDKKSLAYIKTRYDKKETYISMRDGVRLFTSIYSPKDQSRTYPILLIRTPYNIEPNAEGYSGNLLGLSHLLDEGYIIAFQDVRGRFMSEGVFVDVRPFIPGKNGKQIDENSDTYDSIDWLVNNVANNNGRVGIFGISYPGFYSTMSLPEAHPALRAVSPQAPVCNWFLGDDWHHNGAFLLMDAFSFYSTIGRPRPEPTRSWPTPMRFYNEDNYDFFLDIGPVKNIREKYFGDSIQFWSELMSHPNYDDFWKARDPRPHLRNIRPAVLVVGGWFDAEDLYGPLKTYQAIERQNSARTQNRLIMGPWYHGQWASGDGTKLGNIHWGSNTSTYFKEIELRFFNYYLKDKGALDLPEATIFDTGSNEWRSFDRWPPQNAEPRNLYLLPEGGLSFSAPAAPESFDEYVADPDKPVPYTEDVHFRRTVEYLTDDQRFAARRPDVMVYQTPALEEAVTVTGPIHVSFFVSTTGTDADYVVKLIDVFPDQVADYPDNDKDVPVGGYQMLVRGEVLRGRFRNSFENPQPFTPGQATEVSFEIPDVAHTFKPGHRIMVQVQNSWFPLVDRNPQQFVNIYECDESTFIKATHRIYHDAQRPSHLSVQVLPKE